MLQTRVAVDAMEIIYLLSSIFNRDPEHSDKVTDLALTIFDALYPLHGYLSDERRWLKMAAIFHDIGYSQPEQKPHNKASRDLIMAMNIPGIAELDKLTVALIAKYHNGELPDQQAHRDFGELPNDRQEAVKWLAGILRIADGLDCKHQNIVKHLEIDFNDRQITFILESEEDCRKQIKRCQEKDDLLAKVSGRTIKYRC
jgi:exopolyphosphatase / guanosine-5'-triphosphate,3'-diphosphate pyrophosphatase